MTTNRRLSGVSESREKIVNGIRSPLGFFVLSLLIVESFLLGAGWLFGLPLELKVAALCCGVLLFLIVFGAVVWLVVKYPKNLVFSEQSHVQLATLEWGTSETPVTSVVLNQFENLPNPSPTKIAAQPASKETQG